MVPTVEGNVHHFRVVGLYNGLALIADDESGTYWDHITGEAIHGPHRGKNLQFREPLQYMTAQQVLENYPAARTVQEVGIRMRLLQPLLRRMLGQKGQLIPPFLKSMPYQDERRPRLEMGVGLWSTDKDAIFFPLATLKKQGYLMMELGRRCVLIYLDPISHSPDAIYLDAQPTGWDGDILQLANGERVENKMLINADGAVQKVERPRYLLTRWYGFALTFPNCQIWEN